MPKVPSQWTPQEAWAAALQVAEEKLRRGGWPDIVYAIDRIPFPSDPPELVVSDEYLWFVLSGHSGRISQENAIDLARELLARREAERKA